MTESSQLALINGDALTEKDVLSAIDKTIETLYETGDINGATRVLNVLEKIEEVSGHAKARLLYGMYNWWQENQPEKSFYDFVESHSTKNKRVVIDRYVTVQQCIESGQIPASVAIRPMRELVPIAKTLSHGHEIGKDQWKKIAKATGLGEIGEILRNVKGKPARKSSMQIYFDRKGSLTMWKNNKPKFIGWLDLELYNSDEDVKKAIDRILDSAGVIRK